MLKRFCLCLLVVCFSPLMFANDNKMEVSHLVTFGDSLTDDGRLWHFTHHLIPPDPPYHRGRFTNGHSWAEHFSNIFLGSYDKLDNYAVGGAGAVLNNSYTPFTLALQLDSFFEKEHSYGIDSSLFVIWIGANNYLKVDKMSHKTADEEALVNQVVTAIKENAERLVNNGATKIALMGLPDLASAPYFLDHPEMTEPVHRLTEMHNRTLYVNYLLLKTLHPEVTWVYFDTNYFFELVKQTPSDFGVVDVVHACHNIGQFNALAQRQTGTELNGALSQLPDLSPEFKQWLLNTPTLHVALANGHTIAPFNLMKLDKDNDCTDNFFYDTVHPTDPIHRQIAEHMIEAVTAVGLSAASS